MIRLAALSGDATLEFVSTIATALRLEPAGWVLDDDARAPVVAGGYAETKWVAEQLVVAAAEHGLAARSVRLPRVLADSRTGASPPHDAVLLLLRGCIALGAYPDWDGWEPWAPVDDVAGALAASALASDARSPSEPRLAFVAAAPLRFSELFAHARSLGWPLEPVPVAAFHARMASGAAGLAAAALPDWGLEEGGDPTIATAPLVQPLEPVLPGAPPATLTCEYVERMLDYLVAMDELTPPGVEPGPDGSVAQPTRATGPRTASAATAGAATGTS